MGGDTMTLWIARAGRYGERESQALDEGRAFIGWGDLGDLSEAKTRDDVLELMTGTITKGDGRDTFHLCPLVCQWNILLRPFRYATP